ncbi:MAG TPA: hypothetical protein DDW49_02705 [Deltaproteobacteria bacterium]|nr:MAG: hypothetical protein A2048_00700 [Deltaproteobacteria bacterium GWA2_45_12]HBF12289.1 hypothetical protein [Deltaproteobacteria bacterium]
MEAVLFKSPELVDALLTSGAEVNLKDLLGRTVLILLVTYRDQASEDEKISLAQKLVFKGGDLSVRDQNGQTAKEIAQSRGLARLAEIL